MTDDLAKPRQPFSALLPARFRLLGTLGEGGHGIVLKAEDLQTRQLVALKVFKGKGTQAQRNRLAREASLASQLSSASVVPLVDSDVTATPPWLAFRFIPGAVPLGTWQRMQSLRERAESIRMAAEAAGEAHLAGIVHRDLKPENILVDPAGRIYLIDFGVAIGATDQRLTATGAWVGTPHYMSPEQLGGRTAEELRPTADVWALGVMLYEALSERLPFPGPTMIELASQVAAGRLASIRTPDVSDELEKVCFRALSPDPGDRYQTGGEFAKALGEALEREAPASSKGRSWLVSLACAFGAALLILLALPSPRERTTVLEPPRTPQSPTEEGALPVSTPPANVPQESPFAHPTGVLGANGDPGAWLPAELRNASTEELVDQAEAGRLSAMEALAQRRLAQGAVDLGLLWRRKAASGGYLLSIKLLALSLSTGQYGDKDPAEAAQWWKRGGALGDAECLANYGVLLAEGGDEGAAVECFRRAALGGGRLGLRLYGYRLVGGKGVEQDVETGLRFLRQSAERGDLKACEALGVIYEVGEVVEKDYRAAGRWYDLALRKGHAAAHGKWAYLGQMGCLGKEGSDRWVSVASRGAELGDPESLALLGLARLDGLGGAIRNEADAISLLEQARNGESALGAYYLARALALGRGVPKDETRARGLLREAVEGKFTPALHSLAVLLREGRGGKQDLAGAADLERRAAEAGIPEAMLQFSHHLAQGRGVQKDPKKARYWLERAANEGHAGAGLDLALAWLRTGKEEDSLRARELLEELAQDGNARACALLAGALRGAIGTFRQDALLSHQFAQRAAQGGDRLGLLYLGDDNFRGTGCDKSLSNALRHWKAAVEQGSGNACARLGSFYLAGAEGSAPDLSQAKSWFKRGADLGDARCKEMLAELLHSNPELR